MSKQSRLLYEFGPFRFYPDERILQCNRQTVNLPGRAMDVLLVLFYYRDQPGVNKDLLLTKIWGKDAGDIRNLYRAIATLKNTLKKFDGENEYIETIREYGYRFVADLKEVEENNGGLAIVEPIDPLITPIPEQGVRQQAQLQVNQETAQRPASGSSKNRILLWRLGSAQLPIYLWLPSFCLLLILVGGLYYFGIQSKPGNNEAKVSVKSIAVLPARTLNIEDSGDLGLELAEALIIRLSNIRQLTIRPASAIRKYTATDLDPVAAGQEQMVDAVLESKIQKSGNKIRVTVQLIQVHGRTVLWADRFNMEATSLFQIEGSISERVIRALELKLTGEEKQLLAKRYTENTEAHMLCTKGRHFWNKRSEDGLQKAIEHFQQAIELDPNYALAYAGLADSYILLPLYSKTTTKEAYPKAKRAALKALEIDESLAEAYTSLAQVKEYYDWDWLGAEKDYKRAIELNPNYATAHHWYGYYLTRMGRFDEGISELKRALEIDPVSLIINAELGWALMWSRQYDGAIEQLEKTLELDRHFARALEHLGETYALQGKPAEAVEQLIKAEIIWGASPEQIKMLRKGNSVSRWESYLQNQLELVIRDAEKHEISAGYIATMYARLGKKDEAFKWLEKAYKAREGEMGGLKVNPHWNNLREDPRFADLIRRVGLPQ